MISLRHAQDRLEGVLGIPQHRQSLESFTWKIKIDSELLHLWVSWHWTALGGEFSSSSNLSQEEKNGCRIHSSLLMSMNKISIGKCVFFSSLPFFDFQQLGRECREFILLPHLIGGFVFTDFEFSSNIDVVDLTMRELEAIKINVSHSHTLRWVRRMMIQFSRKGAKRADTYTNS